MRAPNALSTNAASLSRGVPLDIAFVQSERRFVHIAAQVFDAHVMPGPVDAPA